MPQKLIDTLKAIRAWLDGKKTAIGGKALIGAEFIDKVVIGIWHVQIAWLPQVIKTLEWFGLVLGGVGLLHKGAKYVQEKNAAGDGGQ